MADSLWPELRNGERKWRPDSACFDLDAASGCWLDSGISDEDGAAAVSAAKCVNKWMFFEEIMKSGRCVSSATPQIHLLILASLRPAATGRATFIDAGSGTGYLLMAWLLLAGPNSRAVGLELDEKTASAARHRLTAPDAVGNGQACPKGAQATVKVCDALSPDAKALGVEEGSVDAINVGLAVEAPPPALVRLLRVGGLMTLPLIDAVQPADGDPDQAAATFQVLCKAADGTLGPVGGSKGCSGKVSVRFTRGILPVGSGSSLADKDVLERRAQLLRFRIGDRVECHMGPNCWKLGRVVALMYRDSTMPEGFVAPYQIRLDEACAGYIDGYTNPDRLIYASDDSDEYVRNPVGLEEVGSVKSAGSASTDDRSRLHRRRSGVTAVH